jgi:selT/selW/selH-like putative selenoprotein
MGSGGIFEIYVNKKLIHSKKETGIFPDEDKILEEISEII